METNKTTAQRAKEKRNAQIINIYNHITTVGNTLQRRGAIYRYIANKVLCSEATVRRVLYEAGIISDDRRKED